MDGASYTLSKQYTDERMKNSPSPLFGTNKTPWEIYKQIPFRAKDYRLVDDLATGWDSQSESAKIFDEPARRIYSADGTTKMTGKDTTAFAITGDKMLMPVILKNVLSFTIYAFSTVTPAAYFSYAYPSANTYDGFHLIAPPLKSFVAEAGTPSWGSITRVSIRAYARDATKPCEMIFGKMATYSSAYPLISIEFDDGDATQYTEGFAKMNAMVPPIPGGISINSGTVDTAGRVTRKQMQEMKGAGWEFYNHAGTHVNLTTITGKELENKILECTDYLLSLFPDKGAFHITPPFAKVNDEVLSIAKKYGISCRYKANKQNNLPVTDQYSLAAYGITDTVTVATIQGWIDECIANKSWLILLVHTIGATGANITPANFQLVLDYITQKVNTGELKAVTRSEGLAAF